ncbi:MAG: hypothetical protein KDB79_08560 [Acidobacteria bacterium]|nr:hypothetical protein [Acidobacteriota bacterium]
MKKNQNRINTFALVILLPLTSTIACQVSSDKNRTVSASVNSSNMPGNDIQQKQTDDLIFSKEGWIYYLSASNKQPQKIVEGEFPSLNIKKKQFVYLKPQPPEADAEAVLMLYDLTTKKTRELYRVKGFVNYPRFAPEGDLILFILRTNEGKTKLEVFNTGGEEAFTLNQTNKEINDVFSPVWAADGNTVYFHDMTNLFHVGFDGQVLSKIPLKTITGSRETITSSDWFIPSPKNENLLIFTQLVPGTPLFEKTFGEPNTALFMYNLKENKKTRLTPEDMFAVDPIWSTNGESLYFIGYYDRNGQENFPFRIFSIQLDGSNIVELARGENVDN